MRFLFIFIFISLISNSYANDEETFKSAFAEIQDDIEAITDQENLADFRIWKVKRKLGKIYNSDSIQKILKKHRPYSRVPFKKFEGVSETMALKMTFQQKLKWLITSFRILPDFKKELSILNILRNTHGSDLFCLKQAIDNQETRNNMYQLIFDKVNDSIMRNLLLFHFKEQAEKNRSKWVTIPMSDLDDTAYNSFKDSRFPKRSILYPGFVKTLETVIESNKITPLMRKRNCVPGAVFLTGRGEGFGLTLIGSLTKKGIPVKKTVLFGSFGTMLATGFTNKPMADKKVERSIDYSRVFPEKRYIMFGDNGQLDSRAYIKLGKKVERKKALVAYINNIRNRTYEGKVNEWDFRNKELVRVLDSYPQMILDMYNLGLLKDKKMVKEVLLSQIKEINSYSTNKKYLRKGGMRDYLIEGIRLYCEKLHSIKRRICRKLPLK